MERARKTLRLEKPLERRLRLRAKREGRSEQEVLVAALEKYLEPARPYVWPKLVGSRPMSWEEVEDAINRERDD